MSGNASTNKWKFRLRKGILFFLLLTPLWSYLAWLAKPSTTLKVVMLDKTAQDFSNIEHRAFTWVLNHAKYVKEDGEEYNQRIDYLGYFPSPRNLLITNDLKNSSPELIDSIADYIEVGYFIDTYGSYYEDWQDRVKDIPKRGQIYGGLESEDVSLMQSLMDRKKLVLAEFSIFGSPTPEVIRSRAEELLGIHFTGWVGRYYEELDTALNTELPHWIPELYTQQFNEPYALSGPGVGFFNEDGRILVLSSSEMVHPVPIIETEEALAESLGVDAFIRYPFWFEVGQIDTSARVVSQYRIYANPEGASKMRALGIPQSFPAVIAKPDWRTIYMAGDFTDNPIAIYSSHFEGSEHLSPLWYDNKNPGDRRKFFWDYYQPFIEGTLARYKNEMDGNNVQLIPLAERSSYRTTEKLLVNFNEPKVNWNSLPEPKSVGYMEAYIPENDSIEIPETPIVAYLFLGSFGRNEDAHRFIESREIPHAKVRLGNTSAQYDIVIPFYDLGLAKRYRQAIKRRYPQAGVIQL